MEILRAIATLHFDAFNLVKLQDEAIERWHGVRSAFEEEADTIEAKVLRQHRSNFDLWHEEDQARDPRATDAVIADIKRRIDRLNQQRNDQVEKLDEFLYAFAGEQQTKVPLHSETPGMMIDRMSILALKIFHTREESFRSEASEAHRSRSGGRLVILEQQRSDLAECLDELWQQVARGQRRFKLYRQMKMYNDAESNPVLYSRPQAHYPGEQDNSESKSEG